MRIAFIGTSHAAQHLSTAARLKGFEIVAPGDGDLTFVSEDTPTDEWGRRDLGVIRELVAEARKHDAPVILTSAVPPGFTRSLGFRLWHQAETLRMRDAAERALNPEMLIIGADDPGLPLPEPYDTYLRAFRCPRLVMKWEEAEFAKLAINCYLAAQVACTTDLAAAAKKVGASWRAIQDVLRRDSRIGHHAYLEPGDWQRSRHLVRDMRTLLEISG